MIRNKYFIILINIKLLIILYQMDDDSIKKILYINKKMLKV